LLRKSPRFLRAIALRTFVIGLVVTLAASGGGLFYRKRG
jgi:hypothetical protein